VTEANLKRGGSMKGSGARAVLLAFVAVVALALVAAPLAARRTSAEIDPIDLDLNAARHALVLGDAAESIRLYQSVLEREPENNSAFWGLVKAYATAGMDRELLALLERRLEERPRDRRAMVELGAAHARLGEFDRAHETWLRAIAESPDDPDSYYEIGALELRHRMYEDAVGVYLEGRRVIGHPGLYGQELVQAYTVLGEYERAVAECLVVAEERGGLVQWATNRIELMLDAGAPRRNIRRWVGDIAESSDASPAGLAFAGSVFLVLDEPDRALAAFLRADELTGEGGRELVRFATILRDGGDLPEAREAFLMAAERHPETETAAAARVEAARILPALGDPRGGVAELKAVANEFPGWRESGEALLAAARIEVADLRDPEAALRTIEELSIGSRARLHQIRHSGALLEIDAYLMLGRLDDAYARATSLLEEGTRDEVSARAMFQLGYVSFLRLDARKAIDELRAMVESDPAGRLVNEALRLMLVIAESEESGAQESLELFASAHSARLTGDTAAARVRVNEIASHYAGSPAAPEALMLLGAIEEEAGDLEAALDVYARVVESEKAIRVLAEARMRRGDILLEEKGRADAAIAEYAAILDDLPPNFLSGEARRKLDRLRRGGELEG